MEQEKKEKKGVSTKRKVGSGAAGIKKNAENEPQIKIVDTDQFEVRTIVEAMLEKKGKNVCSLDLKSLGTAICDYFVICNADSNTNVLAIADNVEDQMVAKCNRKVVRMQGKENAFWIILDYTNIVVHIFQTEYREFYRLEDLWADSAITRYDSENE